MKLQNKIFGIDTREAYERLLREEDSGKNKKPERKPSSSNVSNANIYLILPGRQHGNYEYPDLLVSTDRSHLGRNWNDAYEALRQEDSFMLNPRQFVDFLSLLKSGEAYDGNGKRVNREKLGSVLDDIVKVKSPVRAEWLDAKFSKQGTIRKKWYMGYRDFQGNEIINPLEDCLRSDKVPGIDLNYWLSNATSQGLPPSNNTDGGLYYWHPRDGAVVRFGAGSDWVFLGCNGYPDFSDSALGVRRAKIKV